MPDGAMAAHLVLAQIIEVRVLVGQFVHYAPPPLRVGGFLVLSEWCLIREHNGYEIDDDSARTDFEAVHTWLAGTYWSPGISREQVERGARHSTIVVGAFEKETGAQAGFLRVVSDTTRFAWICDVFVDSAHRSKGLARQMVRFAVEHPDLVDVSRWILATRDAHDVYRSAGFGPLPEPSRWMQYRPDATDGQGC